MSIQMLDVSVKGQVGNGTGLFLWVAHGGIFLFFIFISLFYAGHIVSAQPCRPGLSKKGNFGIARSTVYRYLIMVRNPTD